MITYGGVVYKRVRHAIYCKICKETLESRGVHDFKMCTCGSVGIDDERVLGDRINMESRKYHHQHLN